MRHIYLFMLLPLLFISCGRTQVSSPDGTLKVSDN